MKDYHIRLGETIYIHGYSLNQLYSLSSLLRLSYHLISAAKLSPYMQVTSLNALDPIFPCNTDNTTQYKTKQELSTISLCKIALSIHTASKNTGTGLFHSLIQPRLLGRDQASKNTFPSFEIVSRHFLRFCNG